MNKESGSEREQYLERRIQEIEEKFREFQENVSLSTSKKSKGKGKGKKSEKTLICLKNK